MKLSMAFLSLSAFFFLGRGFAIAASDLDMAKSMYTPGAFEIYMIPQENNMLAAEDVYFDGWGSHLPIDGKYIFKKHRGTDHGLPYDYDTHIPLVFLGEKYINQGNSSRKISFYDIPTTITYILGMPRMPYSTGEPLIEALIKGRKRPSVLLVFVLDQVGWNYLNYHEGSHQFLDDAMKAGFVYKEARLTHAPSVTAVSHATLGTGVAPKYHGIIANQPFKSGLNSLRPVYASRLGLDIAELKTPTIADIWDKRNGNNAQIISYGIVSRTAIGMGGHGAAFKGGDKDAVFWYGSEYQGFSTDQKIFELPKEAKRIKFENYKKKLGKFPYWGEQGCLYPVNVSLKPWFTCWKGSPAATLMEGDMLEKVIKGKPLIGKDNITDLIFINFKAADYCGHFQGPESLECGVTLKEIDKQLRRVFNLLNRQTGGDMITIITADHGSAPLTALSGGTMIFRPNLAKELNKRFDRLENGMPVVESVYKSTMNVNLLELKANGYSIDDLKAYLKDYKVDGKKFFRKVYTYKEFD